jgi:PAS domain-containing protein
MMNMQEKQFPEKHMAEMEELAGSIFGAMSEGICLHEMVYDGNGKPVSYRIIGVNPGYERITRMKAAEIIGKDAKDAYKTKEAPYLDVYSKVAQTGKPTKFETYFEPMKAHFSISVISPKKGLFLTVFSDITEEKKLQTELQKKAETLEEKVRELELINKVAIGREVRMAELKKKLQETGKLPESGHRPL